MKKYFLLSLWIGLSVAITSASKLTPAQSAAGGVTAGAAADASESVWITRADGSKSCASDTAQSVEQGAQELKAANIQVLASKKGTDGKMHPMMCGAPTGTQNVYQIPASQLAAAIALGFKSAEKPSSQQN